MSQQKPLILAEDPTTNIVGQPIIQRLQTGQDLDIPLQEKFQALNIAFVMLVTYMINEGFELPEELIQYLNNNENYD